MSKVLEEIIHESQTAYIPGRYVHDNLRSIELIKQYCKEEKIIKVNGLIAKQLLYFKHGIMLYLTFLEGKLLLEIFGCPWCK